MGGTWLPHCPAGGEPRGLDSARPCLSLRASPARAHALPQQLQIYLGGSSLLSYIPEGGRSWSGRAHD